MNNYKIELSNHKNKKDNILPYNYCPEMKKIKISSSSPTNKMIINLSNPTNLTNPLIIVKHKKYYQNNSYENDFLSNREYKINKLNDYNKLLFNLSNKINSLKSELNLLKESLRGTIINSNNEKYKQNNFKKLKPISYNKKTKNIKFRNQNYFIKHDPKSYDTSIKERNYKNLSSIFLYDSKNFNSTERKNNNNIDKDINPIWEKLKNSRSISPFEKDKKIDKINYIQKYEFIDIKNKIQLYKYQLKIKDKRYNQIKKLNEKELNSLDNMKNYLEKSCDKIQRNYQENYVTNIINLSREIEKEKLELNNLLNNENILIKQISILKNKIKKLSEEKENILNWIYLQIKIKEKKKNLPLYYKDIIENKMSLDDLIKKYKLNPNILNDNEYKKIKEYKEKLIFNDIDQLNEIYHSIEIKIFYNLYKRYDNINQIKELKNEKNLYLEDNTKIKDEYEKNKIISLEQKEEELIHELKKLKFKNKVLYEDYSKIINYKNYFNNDNNKISFYNINTDRNSISKIDNFIFNKTINKNKKLERKSSLFLNIMNFYKEISKLNIIKKRIKFKISLSKEKIILDILEYIEELINFLYEEKKNYYSKEELKTKYKFIENKFNKEAKNENILKQLEIQDRLLIDKMRKTINRINKRNYFKPKKKIDFEYYKRELNKKNNKNNDKQKDIDANTLQYFFY